MPNETSGSFNIKEYHRRWVLDHQEYLKEYYRAWRVRNRERLIVHKRDYNSRPENRKRNYNLMREWRNANPEEQRLHRQVRHANAQAKKYGLPDRLGIKDVRGLPERCNYCDTSENLTIDHVYPMSKGGPNRRENLTTACLTCNQKKNARLLSEALT